MTTTFESRGEERGENFFGEADANDARTDAEHVRVVVRAGETSRVHVVTQRRAYATYLVGRHLLSLPAATEHDADVGFPIAYRPANLGTDRRIVNGGSAVRADVVDDVPVARQYRDEVLLQFKAGVIGANRDTGHSASVGAARTSSAGVFKSSLSTYPGAVPFAHNSVRSHTPVLIGAGQFVQHARDVENALDPASLMCEAIRVAAADAGLAGVPATDSVRVVSLLSWRYGDPALVVAQQLGLTPRQTAVTTMGGNSPQSLVNETAFAIQRGELDLAILCGGEAWQTRGRARKAGTELRWPKAAADAYPVVLGEELEMNHPAERERGLLLPVQIYPMFETAIRAAAGRTLDEQRVLASELWARFSEVAAGNPAAWMRTVRTPHEIRTPAQNNRMIGFPYTKYMNSNNNVDMAAALIMCSAARAQSLGVASDRWVFPLAGADCHEHNYVSNRWSFDKTPAIASGGRAALQLASTTIDEIEIIDLYSCFPSAVQLGAQSLGLSLDRQLTRTGGLSFAGGPWNNYSMHAIATVIRELREQAGTLAFVWANGGYATKHSFGVYGTAPPDEFRHTSPQAEIDAMPRRELADIGDAAGGATVEAYTVMHSREGVPETAFAACLLPDGRRAWGTSTDTELAAAMCNGEWVGRATTLTDAGRLEFS